MARYSNNKDGTLSLIAGNGNTDAIQAMLNKTSDNIAPKQATNTASKLIKAGEYFVNANGDLCVCDVQIASGGTIIVGSNCHVIPGGGVNEVNSRCKIISIATNGYESRTITVDGTAYGILFVHHNGQQFQKTYVINTSVNGSEYCVAHLIADSSQAWDSAYDGVSIAYNSGKTAITINGSRLALALHCNFMYFST